MDRTIDELESPPLSLHSDSMMLNIVLNKGKLFTLLQKTVYGFAFNANICNLIT